MTLTQQQRYLNLLETDFTSYFLRKDFMNYRQIISVRLYVGINHF